MKQARCIGAIILLCALGAQAGGVARPVRDIYPNLVHGLLAAATLAELPEGVILQCTELEVTQKDLADILAGSPAAIREQLRKNAVYLVDELATKKLLGAVAKREALRAGRSIAGKSNEEIVDDYAQGVIAGIEVTDAEVAEFYESNEEMFGGASLRKVRDSLRKFLVQNKRRKALEEHVSTLARGVRAAVSAPWIAQYAALARDNPVDKARASGLPSMVSFGGDGCRPCERMRPALATLAQKFAGRANIVLVQANVEIVLARRYGIHTLPTQIFYDKTGREVFQHVGYYSQREIEAKLKEMGVE